jgi:hypothetical protein
VRALVTLPSFAMSARQADERNLVGTVSYLHRGHADGGDGVTDLLLQLLAFGQGFALMVLYTTIKNIDFT